MPMDKPTTRNYILSKSWTTSASSTTWTSSSRRAKVLALTISRIRSRVSHPSPNRPAPKRRKSSSLLRRTNRLHYPHHKKRKIPEANWSTSRNRPLFKPKNQSWLITLSLWTESKCPTSSRVSKWSSPTLPRSQSSSRSNRSSNRSHSWSKLVARSSQVRNLARLTRKAWKNTKQRCGLKIHQSSPK